MDLSRFDSTFGATQPHGSRREANGGEDIPDGEYEAVIEEFALTKSRKSGEPMLVWTFRIASGPMQGRSLKKFRIIRDSSVGWIREELAHCGLALDRLSDLREHGGCLIGARVRVARRTRNGYPEVYINAPRTQPARSAGE